MAKILVVDDDTTFCIMLKNWLGKRKFEVENAFTCKEAVKKLEGTAFDVVLTDLRLPDKDGIDLLRIIKEKTPQAQVILMTGYADIQTAVTAKLLSATGAPAAVVSLWFIGWDCSSTLRVGQGGSAICFMSDHREDIVFRGARDKSFPDDWVRG